MEECVKNAQKNAQIEHTKGKNLKINTNKLAAALKNLSQIAKPKNTLPILSCVLIESTTKGLQITADNLDMRQSEIVEAEGISKKPFCVNYAHLAISVGQGEETTLELTDNHLTIQPSGVKLATLDAADFPASPTETFKGIGVSCADVADGIDAVSWDCKKPNAGEPSKEAVNLVGEPKQLTAVATDGASLALFQRGIICSAFDVNIHQDFCAMLSYALRREGAVVSISDKRVRVVHGSGSYSCKLWEPPFPNWKCVMPDKITTLGEAEAEPIKDYARMSLGLFDDPENFPSARLKFNGTGLDIESKFKTTEASRHFDGKFSPLEIRFNLQKLASCLGAFGVPKVMLSATDEFSPMKMAGGDLTVLLMPTRMS